MVYQDLSTDEFAAALVSAGVPEFAAAIYADSDRGLKAGDLLVDSGHLEQLIDRPSTPLADAIRTQLA